MDKLTNLQPRIWNRTGMWDRASDENMFFGNVPNFSYSEKVKSTGLMSEEDKSLFKRYWATREPLHISGGFIPPSVIEKWQDVDSLRHAFGKRTIKVNDGHVVDMLDNIYKIEMTFSEYLDRILCPEYDGDRLRLYLVSDLPKHLLKDVVPLIKQLLLLAGVRYDPSLLLTGENEGGRNVLIQAFVGRRTYTGSHEHGGFEALLIQLAGAKEVLLHRPTEQNRRALYAGTIHNWPNWSPVKIYALDMKEHPDFLENLPTYTSVAAGEILYIPDGWFHAVAARGDGLCGSLTLFYQTDESLLRTNSLCRDACD